MPSNLPAAVNTGQINACLFRVARLAPDCSPLGGNNSGYVTAGLASFSTTPDTEEGTSIRPKNTCGRTLYTYDAPTVTNGHNVTGALYFFDPEAAFVLFGGSVVLGGTNSDFSGDVIGWASPNYTDPPTDGVYLEIISQNIGEGAGDCAATVGGFAAYTGHIWGKVKLTMGERSFAEEAAEFAFTGVATGNPNLFDGPWNDYPGAPQTYVANTPYQTIGYSQAEFETILALAAPGFADLPAAS